MSTTLSNVYAAGLADEKLVKQFLMSMGLTVTEPTTHQDRMEDTDCFVNGVAVSIKSQQSGAKYNNICFELGQHLTSHNGCSLSAEVVASKTITEMDINKLVSLGSWEHSWYQNGKASMYYIYQGHTLHIFKKSDIVAHVARHGWLRIRPLTKMRSSYLGGTYRYCNAICGYLDTDIIPHLTYKLVKAIPLAA